MTTKESVKRIISNGRVIFLVPNMIDRDAPMCESIYFKWLNESVTKQENFYKTITPYLAPGGYDIEKHTLESSELKSLECIFNYYQTMYTPIRNPCRLKALLKPVEKGFHLYGDSDTKYKPTTILKMVLIELGLVYPLLPEHYYFQVKNGFLFIQYNQILGSRRLAKIVTDNKAFNQSNEVNSK